MSTTSNAAPTTWRANARRWKTSGTSSAPWSMFTRIARATRVEADDRVPASQD